MEEGGAVDWKSLDALVDWHVEEGTHGIVPVGTTGESATLTATEQTAVIAAVVNRVDGRIPVIAGTGANSTQQALALTHSGRAAGADACLIVTPYYNKPPQEGLYRHYCTIADQVDVPIVLYNVPSRTACDLLAQTVARLAKHERIIGIKEACGTPDRVSEIKQRVDEKFIVLSGEDSQTLTMMQYGAVGTISVSANVVPNLMSKFCQSYLSGNIAEANELDRLLQPLHEVLFLQTNPIPAKWALHAMNRIPSGLRLPLVALAEEHHASIRNQLMKFKAL
ncbi:MAG: 4-hydroxy-tetrahydrodipicolinate synthase [Gammaproteobacteria bacterium]|nr:4-hydroxy-tetrahydrodipicolinate synthase [Gammaproteobacteria bacterium]